MHRARRPGPRHHADEARPARSSPSYLTNLGLKVRYLHSEVETLKRVEVLRDLRLGRFDVLVGINLLREGLDLPEVSLVAILDADKEGYLRSETSHHPDRRAREPQRLGTVVLYADRITGSMARAIAEMSRRRTAQVEYNEEHGIVPETIRKEVRSLLAPEEEAPSGEPLRRRTSGRSGRSGSRSSSRTSRRRCGSPPSASTSRRRRGSATGSARSGDRQRPPGRAARPEPRPRNESPGSLPTLL